MNFARFALFLLLKVFNDEFRIFIINICKIDQLHWHGMSVKIVSLNIFCLFISFLWFPSATLHYIPQSIILAMTIISTNLMDVWVCECACGIDWRFDHVCRFQSSIRRILCVRFNIISFLFSSMIKI